MILNQSFFFLGPSDFPVGNLNNGKGFGMVKIPDTPIIRDFHLLPEEFSIYLDDYDLSLRIWDAGYRIQSCPDADLENGAGRLGYDLFPLFHHRLGAAGAIDEMGKDVFFVNTHADLLLINTCCIIVPSLRQKYATVA